MKLDYKTVSDVERANGVTLLYTVKMGTPYIYTKVKRDIPDSIIYLTVKTARGRDHVAPFIRNEDLDSVTSSMLKKKSSSSKKRSFMGRPYSFCEGCWAKDFCSEEFPCEKRDEKMRNKAFIESVKEDDRFWKNGVPKKYMILCKYAKYMYAHKKTAGQCQKEKCRFYVDGGCYLGLDKDK